MSSPSPSDVIQAIRDILIYNSPTIKLIKTSQVCGVTRLPLAHQSIRLLLIVIVAPLERYTPKHLAYRIPVVLPRRRPLALTAYKPDRVFVPIPYQVE